MTIPDSHRLVEEAIAAFGRGEIVVVADDDDRENEGDLFVAASLCTAEKMAFIRRYTSGIICAPLSVDEAKRLHLDPMVALNDAPLGTAFTVSVDVRHGLTTGISAEERSNTARALANPNSGAADFVRPGVPRRNLLASPPRGGQDTRRKMIRHAIDKLPEKQRAAVLLHKYQELDYAEIAKILACSESALKSLLFRAYEALRVELAPLVAQQARNQG